MKTLLRRRWSVSESLLPRAPRRPSRRPRPPSRCWPTCRRPAPWSATNLDFGPDDPLVGLRLQGRLLVDFRDLHQRHDLRRRGHHADGPYDDRRRGCTCSTYGLFNEAARTNRLQRAEQRLDRQWHGAGDQRVRAYPGRPDRGARRCLHRHGQRDGHVLTRAPGFVSGQIGLRHMQRLLRLACALGLLHGNPKAHAQRAPTAWLGVEGQCAGGLLWSRRTP